MTTDQRRRCPIFMASSHLLKEERERFDAIVGSVAEKFARHLLIHPVRWERDAYGASRGVVNGSIRDSVAFEESAVVVVAIDGFVHAGTIDEFEMALQLSRFRGGYPKLLVYVRERDPQAAEVAEFREGAFRRGVVVSPYASLVEFEEKLRAHLGEALNDRARAGFESRAGHLRTAFLGAAVTNVVLAAGVTALCRIVRPPDGSNFTYWSVLAILAAPLVLLFTGWLANWYYERLLTALCTLWRSPDWTESEGYDAFRGLVPRSALPSPLNRRVPAIGPIATLALGLSMLGGCVAQFNCLFSQFLLWEFAVGWEVTLDATGVPVAAEDGTVTQQFVDRQRQRWPFGLQNPRVRAALEAEALRRERPLIYVHARGRFGEPGIEPFRRNLGPEVRLPAWPWCYLAMLLATAGMGMKSLWRLTQFRYEVVR